GETPQCGRGRRSAPIAVERDDCGVGHRGHRAGPPSVCPASPCTGRGASLCCASRTMNPCAGKGADDGPRTTNATLAWRQTVLRAVGDGWRALPDRHAPASRDAGAPGGEWDRASRATDAPDRDDALRARRLLLVVGHWL